MKVYGWGGMVTDCIELINRLNWIWIWMGMGMNNALYLADWVFPPQGQADLRLTIRYDYESLHGEAVGV